jgi:seryl-tRNA synthetase
MNKLLTLPGPRGDVAHAEGGARAISGQALFLEMGVPGVRGTSALFESVVSALMAAIDRLAPEAAERRRFPPVMSRAHIVQAGYDRTFPHLLGAVHAAATGAEGAPLATDLVLAPASCYPIYPHLAAEGGPLGDGRMFDVSCDCFRREPSRNPTRLQSFRMREFVFVGAPSAAAAFRDAQLKSFERLLADLALAPKTALANDPFFGPGASYLKARQRAEAVKFELVVEVGGEEPSMACASFNYHHAHFGEAFDLRLDGEAPAHSACAAVGLDRLALALFVRHGLELQAWPAGVLRALAR